MKHRKQRQKVVHEEYKQKQELADEALRTKTRISRWSTKNEDKN